MQLTPSDPNSMVVYTADYFLLSEVCITLLLFPYIIKVTQGWGCRYTQTVSICHNVLQSVSYNQNSKRLVYVTLQDAAKCKQCGSQKL